MKVLLVNGSPHESGTTSRALKEICEVLNEENIETEIFWLGKEPVAGCIGCMHCRKNPGGCFRNDLVNEFLKKQEMLPGLFLVLLFILRQLRDL